MDSTTQYNGCRGDVWKKWTDYKEEEVQVETVVKETLLKKTVRPLK